MFSSHSKIFPIERQLPNKLNLSQQGVTDAKIQIIINYLKDHPEITNLDLSFNDIGDEGIALLARYPGLLTLNLQGNRAGLLSAYAFAFNVSLLNLNLAGNNIPSAGVDCILTYNTKLISLNLYGNEFDDNAVKGVVGNTTLRILNLRGNRLTDKTAKFIGQNNGLVQVDLRGNFITDIGAKALTGNPTIKYINIKYNDLSAQGLKTIYESKDLLITDYGVTTVNSFFIKPAEHGKKRKAYDALHEDNEERIIRKKRM